MGTLKHNWVTDYLIDFEYKKYVLLGFLQETMSEFDRLRLFPALSDLIFHYRNLMHFIESKELIDENLPVELSSVDLKAMKLIYQQMAEDDKVMQVVNEIVAFAMPQIEDAIYQGREIYEIVEEHIAMDTVGVVPLYTKEGYFVLTDDETPEASVYRYTVSSIEKPEESFRTISSNLVKQVKKSKFESAGTIKEKLIEEYKELPTPAIFQFHTMLNVPYSETFLPVTKRILLKHLLQAA